MPGADLKAQGNLRHRHISGHQSSTFLRSNPDLLSDIRRRSDSEDRWSCQVLRSSPDRRSSPFRLFFRRCLFMTLVLYAKGLQGLKECPPKNTAPRLSGRETGFWWDRGHRFPRFRVGYCLIAHKSSGFHCTVNAAWKVKGEKAAHSKKNSSRRVLDAAGTLCYGPGRLQRP